MRELKVRAWTGSAMLQVVKLNLLKFPNGQYAELGQGYYLEGPKKGENVNFSMRSSKLLEYTGLKDKNGKDIYEKDVLFREGYWGYYIGFEKGCFVTVPLDDVQRINWEHKPLKDIDLSRWEIIGNIYEKPELLEQRHD